jgi:putative transposase
LQRRDLRSVFTQPGPISAIRRRAKARASPSFVREPEGNGVAERFIRTLKENLLWVRTFSTIEELRTALSEFARHYNRTWLVARHGYNTPDQVRAAQLSVARANIAELSWAA